MAGIYIHIPFCYKRCDYCDFFKTTNITLKSDFLNILKEEIDENAKLIDNEIIETIYFGGGTPSVLSGEEVKNILDHLFSKIKHRDKLTEITFELNPDDSVTEYLEKLKHAGVNRLSIGIQSFDETLLKILNRRHDAAQALQVVSDVRNAGFENISIDLMYGLPGMDMATWENTVETALNLRVEHISAYHLTYEQGTVFFKKLEKSIFKETPENESLKQFDVLIRKLKNTGYEHYEISNFSLPGKRSLHNSSYWSGSNYFGFGPSAHSYNGNERWWNVGDLNKYLKGEFIEKKEVLSETDKYNELIMLKLRTAEGVRVEEIEKTGDRYYNYFLKNVKKHINSEDVRYSGMRYTITSKGIFISDYIIADMFF